MSSDASDASSSMEPLRSGRTRTISTSSASSSDSECGTPMAPRLPPVVRACVLRAPCLKRNASAPPPSSSSSSSAHEAVPTVALAALTSVSVGRPRVAPMCSFAAPRSFSAAAPPRSVRFDEAPPEHGLTHSGRHYDRTPIECTRNGSEHDLSLKHTVTYGRDDEESEASGPESDECARRGKARWASLKNGTVIGSAVHESTVPRAAGAAPAEPNGCSLPVHGVRSFGGLGAKAGGASLYASSVEDDSLDETAGLDDADDDDGDSTAPVKSRKPDPFAALRPRTKSPDATPRQSPSVRCRWENVQDYFAVAADEGSDGDDEGSKPARSASTASPLRAASPSGSRIADTHATADDEGESLRRSILLAASSKSRRSAASPRASPRGSPRRSPRGSPHESRSSSPQPASPPVLSPPLPASTSAAPAAELSSAVDALAVSIDAPAEASTAPSASEPVAGLSLFGSVCSPSVGGGSSSAMPLFVLDSSPMSSRCSSTDPWSGVSSDETDALPDSPSGGWGSSSCTSPDLTPADIAARVSSAVDKVLVSQQQQQQDVSVLAATLPHPPSPEHDGGEARSTSMLPPSVLAACHLTPSSSRPSALRSRRAASAGAKMTLSADNSPLLWPADDDERSGSGSGGSASVTPVPGAKPKKKGCASKRRARASFSESAFSAGGFDEGALGGF